MPHLKRLGATKKPDAPHFGGQCLGVDQDDQPMPPRWVGRQHSRCTTKQTTQGFRRDGQIEVLSGAAKFVRSECRGFFLGITNRIGDQRSNLFGCTGQGGATRTSTRRPRPSARARTAPPPDSPTTRAASSISAISFARAWSLGNSFMMPAIAPACLKASNITVLRTSMNTNHFTFQSTG